MVDCPGQRPGSARVVHPQQPAARRGFSLIELVIVISVAVLLVGLLFPAIAELRENAHRVVCASNQRQIGMAIFMYDRDYAALPYTTQLQNEEHWEPRELNIAHTGDEPDNWDGLGLLFQGAYCRAPDCFYCPSHTGSYRVERSRERWYHPGGDPIYTNFHYSGDVDWVTGQPRDLAIAMRNGNRLVLAADGLRSLESLNHRDGLNLLYGDGSVHWKHSLSGIEDVLPLSEEETLDSGEKDQYQGLWRLIEQGLDEANEPGK